MKSSKRQGNAPHRTWRSLSDPQAIVIAALVAVIPLLMTLLITLKSRPPEKPEFNPSAQMRADIQALLPKPNDEIKVMVYERMCFGFVTPENWEIHDTATYFGGGRIMASKRPGEDMSQIGVEFHVRSWLDRYTVPTFEDYANLMLQEHEQVFENVTLNQLNLQGNAAYYVDYDLSNESEASVLKNGRLYTVLLTKPLLLNMISRIPINDSGTEFWQEVEQIVDSIRIHRGCLDEKVKLATH